MVFYFKAREKKRVPRRTRPYVYFVFLHARVCKNITCQLKMLRENLFFPSFNPPPLFTHHVCVCFHIQRFSIATKSYLFTYVQVNVETRSDAQWFFFCKGALYEIA